MSHAEAMKLIKGGRKLVFYDDLVLDVAKYRWSHPGGKIMFDKTIGEDMGKYLHGCSSIGGKFNPWNHSAQAFKIARQLAIAKLPNKCYISPISGTIVGETNGRMDSEPASTEATENFLLSDGNWEFVEKKLIAHNTYDFTLKSDSVKVPASVSGI